MSGYRLTAPPALSAFVEMDCALCGHESLAHPVWLLGPAGVIAAGTGCAAVALYGDRAPRSQRLVRNEAAALAIIEAAAAAQRAERMSRYATALAEFSAGVDYSPILQSCRTTYWGTVRGLWLGEHRMTFPAFLAAVAADGNLPE